MSHDRDHDHPLPHPSPVPKPRTLPPLTSKPKPDCLRREHPTATPREPIDPRPHPSRRLAMAAARPR